MKISRNPSMNRRGSDGNIPSTSVLVVADPPSFTFAVDGVRNPRNHFKVAR